MNQDILVSITGGIACKAWFYKCSTKYGSQARRKNMYNILTEIKLKSMDSVLLKKKKKKAVKSWPI